MESNRLIRAGLGVATLLAATYVFEPTLFGATLSEGWARTEMLRNIVGVVGAVFGLLLIFDAVFPKPAPPASAATPPQPPAEEPKAEEPAAVAQEAAEAVWGSYIEPAPGAVEAARGLVEAELAERAEAAAETAPTEDVAESTPEPAPEAPEIKVGSGLPPPPPKPPKPEPPTPA